MNCRPRACPPCPAQFHCRAYVLVRGAALRPERDVAMFEWVNVMVALERWQPDNLDNAWAHLTNHSVQVM